MDTVGCHVLDSCKGTQVNIDPTGQHEIVPGRELNLDDPRTRARYLKLTDEEIETLRNLEPKERHEWLKKRLPTKERLARHLEWRGCAALAYRARLGLYSDFESSHPLPKVLLVEDLKRHALHDIVKLVMAGEYDDTRQESDEWAKKQDGDVGQLLDDLGLR